MDTRNDFDHQHDDGFAPPPAPPGDPVGPAPWHRRPWGRTILVAAGIAVAAGLIVGAVALAGRDGTPSAAATPSPSTPVTSPVPSATTTPSPTPTSTATPTEQPEAWAPAFDACGTSAPPAVGTGGVWVGDYGGGIDGDVMTSLDLRWSVISPEDWSASGVTATFVGLWLISDDEIVVGVPASELAASAPVAMSPGSEGGGSGSEGTIELTAQFLACPDGAGGLPPAAYRARVGVELRAGGTMQTAWGDIPVFVPDYATATA